MEQVLNLHEEQHIKEHLDDAITSDDFFSLTCIFFYAVFLYLGALYRFES